MPKTTWDELDKLIHHVKSTCCKLAKIELMCKDLMRELSEEMTELHDIVLKQVDNNNGK